MRIIHLSDIHLSASNIEDFTNSLRSKLIEDLLFYNSEKRIDLLVITGDLLDKGGRSLIKTPMYTSQKPYEVFENEFIAPISEALSLNKQHFLFIPGNHDVDESLTTSAEEDYLQSKINDDTIPIFLNENLGGFKNSERIRPFKEFEEGFHSDNPYYLFTENQSSYMHKSDNGKVGFLLINDSWRCWSQNKETSELYFGYVQLYRALEYLEENETDLNICLFHHGLESFSPTEKIKVKRILNNKNIGLCLYGHLHAQEAHRGNIRENSCLHIRARSGLNRVYETNYDYIPGYQIYDFDLLGKKLSRIIYRIYSDEREVFVEDNLNFPPSGEDSNEGHGYRIKMREVKPRHTEVDWSKYYLGHEE